MAIQDYRSGIRRASFTGQRDSLDPANLLDRSKTRFHVLRADDVSACFAGCFHVLACVLVTNRYCSIACRHLDRIIFSLIAFSLSIRLSLPRVSYVTHADLFLLGCTLLVILALALVVVSSLWAKTERMKDALSLNAAARWFYPGLFFLVAIITLMN